MRTQILGVSIDNTTKEEALNRIQNVFEQNGRLFVTTPNPEMIVAAQKNHEFKDILNRADLALPDGFGLKIAGKINGFSLKERITGTDFLLDLCRLANKRQIKIFLLGGRGGAGGKSKLNLETKFPKLEISTSEEIFTNTPDKKIMLFAAFGHGRQEKIAKELFDHYPNIILAMGVGGAFDFLSGRIKRAPNWARRCGLEWLFRLIIEPWRIRRIWNAVPVFLYYILKNKITKFL